MPEPDPVIKQILRDIKADACGGKEVVGDLSASELSMSEKTLLKNALDSMVSCMTRLLNPDKDPSFTPPDAGQSFTPIDTSGFDLPRYAEVTCEEACMALDDYCNGDTEDAAKHVRRINDIVFEYYDVGGLM